MEVKVPEEIIEPGAEGVISVWLFRSGESVAQGDVLAEVMNAKAATQLAAPASGRLTILVAPEVAIRCGDVVARID
jgi:pyruvate/2-oxoglutarate dehydrogenase complex dihydrolipoamide acyltransferase (E2) component